MKLCLTIPKNILLLLFFLFTIQETIAETVTLPSSCNYLADGYYFILPFDDNTMNEMTSDNELFEERTVAPPIYVYCNNGYTILNVYLDSNIKQYFTTFHDYLESASGPDLNDHTSWDKWFLPARFAGSFPSEESLFSWSVTEADCTKCLSSDELEYGSMTGYYMTPDISSCNWPTKNVCDFDSTTLECYTCDAQLISTATLSGKCGHVQFSVDSTTVIPHAACTEADYSEDIFVYHPSMITQGKYCTCYKPSDSLVSNYEIDKTYYDTIVSEHDEYIAELEAEESDTESTINNIDTNIQYLSSVDFEDGTYRITESGTYILTEDILFNPHSLSEEDIYDNNISPHSEGAWMPYSDQSEDYPGAGEYDGWYWLGFFAAITVEASNVVLDLNGHSISMHEHFYYQQRYFIVIQISNKPFGDSAGPTWTGVGQITDLTNIEIKNGVIGLTSHMGMHAVQCSNVYLSDLVIKDFETHGMIFNGFNNVQLDNVEIGPSVMSQLPVNGNYNLARFGMQVLRDALEDIGDQSITFYNREAVTYSELFEKFQTELDLVFKYIAYNDDSVTSHEYWEEAKSLFMTDLGVSRSGTVYGASFRSKDSSVFSFGKGHGDVSNNLILKDVYIHDLEIATEEIVSIGLASATHQMLNAPMAFMYASDNLFEDTEASTYIGNTWIDLLIALHNLSNDWWYLNRFACDDNVCKGWVLEDTPKPKNLECGWDNFGHVTKGAIGLKMEFVDNVEFSNVELANIHSISKLGSELCGEWTDGTDGGPLFQEGWVNRGYGATFAYGIVTFCVNGTFDDIHIHDIASYFGPSYGHYAIVGNDITVKNSEIYNIFGGIINEEDYSEDRWPNRANRACSVETNRINTTIFKQYHGTDFYADYNYINYQNVEQYCFVGHAGCEETKGTTYSAVTDNEHEIEANSCSKTSMSFSDGNVITIDSDHDSVKTTLTKKSMTYYMQSRLQKKAQIYGLHNKNFIMISLSILFASIIIYYCVKSSCNNYHKRQQFSEPNEYQPLLPKRI